MSRVLRGIPEQSSVGETLAGSRRVAVEQCDVLQRDARRIANRLSIRDTAD